MFEIPAITHCTAMRGPIHLCGPTASGKSSLAVALARDIGGEVVNADAFQLYRGLEILTAAPTADERDAVPHHLFGLLDPGETCDAMRYRTLALPVIEEIAARGRVPIVVGGSGLYLKFLTHGPAPLPTGDERLRRELDEKTLDELVGRLRELDPVEAERTNLGNRRYVTRALEICLLSGRPCSELRDRWESASRQRENELRGICIRRQRPDLHERIACRTRAMLEGGAIAEVAALPELSATFGKAIGYREILALLRNEIDRNRCFERIAAATRQYAKRQETWFRRERWLRPLAWPPSAPPPLGEAIGLVAPGRS